MSRFFTGSDSESESSSSEEEQIARTTGTRYMYKVKLLIHCKPTVFHDCGNAKSDIRNRILILSKILLHLLNFCFIEEKISNNQQKLHSFLASVSLKSLLATS